MLFLSDMESPRIRAAESKTSTREWRASAFRARLPETVDKKSLMVKRATFMRRE